MENDTRVASDWWVFVQDQLDRRGWNGADFERETGISRSRLNSWKAGGTPTPELAKTCAKAFGVATTTAFIYAGWLDSGEAPAENVNADLAAFSNQALLRELERRLDGQYRAPLVPPSMEEVRANPERYTVLGIADSGRSGPVAVEMEAAGDPRDEVAVEERP